MTEKRLTWMRSISIGLVLILASGWISAQNLPVVLEAESGQLGSDFEVIDEDGVTFVRPETDYLDASSPGADSKVITFKVPFVETGTYEVYAKLRVGSENYNDDSFFLSKYFGCCSESPS